MSKKKKLILFVSSTWTFLLSWLVSKCTVLTGSSGTSCDSSMAVGEGVFTVRPGKSVPSVSAASALAKALLESQHGETSLYMLLQPLPLHLAGADPCQVCACTFEELSIMGKSRENWVLRVLIPQSHWWQVSSAQQVRHVRLPHKSTRCFLRTLPLSSTHAWIIWPRLLTCILTYIWWKQGSLYSFLIISKALGVSAQAVTFKGWVRIRSNLILFTPCFL